MIDFIYPALFYFIGLAHFVLSLFVKENVPVTFLFTKDEIPQTVF